MQRSPTEPPNIAASPTPAVAARRANAMSRADDQPRPRLASRAERRQRLEAGQPDAAEASSAAGAGSSELSAKRPVRPPKAAAAGAVYDRR